MQTAEELVIPTWLIPSLYGDVRLEADRTVEGMEATILVAQNLSPTEEAAMEILRRRAIAEPRKFWPLRIGKIPWATAEDFRPIVEKTYRETEVKVRLRAPIAAVAAVLGRAMKPGRRIVSVVKFADGRIEEIHGAATTVTSAATAMTTALALPAKTEKEIVKTEKKKDSIVKKVVVEVAATVAAPTIGCPAPDFGKSEVRARRVLLTFLDDRQKEDLQKTGRFVTKGQDTGRRYLLSLRDGPEGLMRTGGRGVYDLDASSSPRCGLNPRDVSFHGGPLCVHDWTVPPSEEVLAIHLMLSLPGRESLMRRLPEILGQQPRSGLR